MPAWRLNGLHFCWRLGATKDEVSSLQSQASKDKATMEEDYQKALELIFASGYKCCMFKHNICGDQPKVPNSMLDSFDPLPPEFFVNPKCPPNPKATEATTIKADKSKWAGRVEEHERSGLVGDFAVTS